MEHRRRALALILASLCLASIFTVAAQNGPALPSGNIYVPAEGLEVRAGETLHIGPGTKVYGVGPVNVYGQLMVKGTPTSTANFTVPIVVFQGGEVDMEQAHVWTINTTALDVRSATVSLREVLFEGNNRAVQASGTGNVKATRSIFRDHAGEAFYIEEKASVALDNVTFTRNGRGMTIYSTSSALIQDSTFTQNGQHVVVDLYPWSERGPIAFERNHFGAPTPAPTQPPGILLRDAQTVLEGSSQRLITLDSNRIEDAPKGLSVQGGALRVESHNDTIVANGIGILVDAATLRVVEGTFGNEHDLQGSGQITLLNITYLRAPTDDVAPASTSVPSTFDMPWVFAGLAAALVLGGVLVLRRTRGSTAREHPPQDAPLIVSPPVPTPAPAPVVPKAPGAIDPPLTSVERRILDDVLAHPGTAQRATADRLGMTRQALHYHVKKLDARGLILKSVEGRETRCTVPPAVERLLRAPPPTQTDSHEKA